MIVRRLTTLAFAVCLTAPLAMSASTHDNAPNTGVAVAAPAKGKLVKLTLHNKSAQPMTLMVQDAAITIAAGGDYKLSAVEGTDIYDAAHTTVQLHVTRDLGGATVSIR